MIFSARNAGRLGRSLGVAGLAAAMLALISGPSGAYGWGGGGGTSSGCVNSGCTTAFAAALPIPSVLQPTSTDATTDYYTVTEQQANVAVVPGKTTPMWTYNGKFPGPTIKAQSGRTVKLHVVNQLPASTTLHLHGAHVGSDSDGGPVDTFAPGTSRDYTYPNGQSARTQWYHDHAMDRTGKQVYMGLAGFYLIGDAQEAALNLPSGAYDVPLVVQDRQFNTDGTLSYPSSISAMSSSTIRDGFMGDTLLVNGAPQPYFKVSARKYRLRLLNGSNARYYTFSLSNGQAFTQIGNEGGLFSGPIKSTSIRLAPAERADVVVDFSAVPLGTSVVLKNGDSSSYNGSSTTSDVMRFDVATAASDTSAVPATLRPFTPLDSTAVSVRRTFTIDQTNGMWTFNGLGYDPNRIDANVKLNATEEWTFDNRSGQDHPIHMHDINFQVVSTDRGTPTGADAQWKETVNVPGWSKVTVRAKFPDFTGTYMLHCHILEHEDDMLMAQFKVS
jgi:spore coat protein A